MLPLALIASLSSVPAAAGGFDPQAHTVILAAHAEGAQIYACRAGTDGAPAWTFREPIATLIVDGRTIGHHYAGPHWALDDGSIVQGRLSFTVAGATATDIPQLKLAVIANQRTGVLASATLVYRVKTHGGMLEGPCPTLGEFRSVSYSADYLFEK